MKIFISYRRDDAAGHAGHLLAYLHDRFGKQNVFMDIDAIPPGEDFRTVIRNQVSTCDVVLVMIGKQWLNIKDAEGKRRLDNPKDWVRAEIATALANPRIRVIPVLVQGANMPGADELPDDLKELPWRHAFELSDIRFQHDANRLIRMIQREPWWVEPFRRFWKVGLAVLVLLLIGYAVRYILATQQQLQYHVSNQLAQSIDVYGNDEFEGTVAPGATRTFTRLSSADFPISIHWEIRKIRSYGDDMGETIRQVDRLQTVTVDNMIGQTRYFHPVISSKFDQQCKISINDATKDQADGGFIDPHSEHVTPGYFLWRTDSNVTLYCDGKPYWFGIRKGEDSRRLVVPQDKNGMLTIPSFYPPNASP